MIASGFIDRATGTPRREPSDVERVLEAQIRRLQARYEEDMRQQQQPWWHRWPWVK